MTTYLNFKIDKRVPINNKMYIRVEPVEDGLYIYTENQYGALLKMGEKISGKDFISMLNWYRCQKENGNSELLL